MGEVTGLMSRGQFLRLAAAGCAAVSLPISLTRSAFGQRPFSTPLEDAWAEDLFARSQVFDSVLGLAAQRGRESLDFQPGTVKRLVGVDFGHTTTRVQRLDTFNETMKRRSAGVMPVLRFADFATALTARRFGAVYYVQQDFDSELRGSVEPISIWKEKGVRVLQITFNDNLLGGGSESDRPLTGLGRQVVSELNRLRIMVDVSHTGRRTTLDVAAHSTRPVTANHANASRLTDHERNKTDEELKAIAATGGVVGVTNIGRFMVRNPVRPASIDDYVAHLDYIVQLIGIDHVGISSDSSIDGSQVYDIDFSDRYMNSYQRWKHVAVRLRSMGYSDAHLQKVLGQNFLRVYEEVMEP